MYLLQLSNTVSTDGKKSPKLRFLPIFWNNNSQNASMKVKMKDKCLFKPGVDEPLTLAKSHKVVLEHSHTTILPFFLNLNTLSMVALVLRWYKLSSCDKKGIACKTLNIYYYI